MGMPQGPTPLTTSEFLPQLMAQRVSPNRSMFGVKHGAFS